MISAGGGRIAIASEKVAPALRRGASVAVDGVCLTVADRRDDGFAADVMPETERRTTIGSLQPGDAVNLERSLAFGDPVGGHMVTGHVDAVGAITLLRDDGNARWVTVAVPRDLAALIAEKGCVAVDGISLTVVEASAGAFTVSLIPHTRACTTAGRWAAGSRVNIEADVIARYVHRTLTARTAAAVPPVASLGV